MFNNKLVINLLKECAKMKEFDHPNVLNLKGVCLDGGPVPYIIMPYMTNGSLQSYLKENRESLVIEPSPADLTDVVRKIFFMGCNIIIVVVTGRKRIRLVISLECFIEITQDFLCPFMND